MTPAVEEANRLLRIARRDLGTAQLLLPLEGASVAAIGFHAQQCTEKALKAVCILLHIEVRRTHDLVALGQVVISEGATLPVSLDELRTLNLFAVEFRYDDEILPDIQRDETHRIAQLVLQWAAEQID